MELAWGVAAGHGAVLGALQDMIIATTLGKIVRMNFTMSCEQLGHKGV